MQLNTRPLKIWKLKEDFENLCILSRFFVFDDWKEIRKTMEDLFQSKIIINPLFVENALIKLDEGSLKEFVGKEAVWQVMGPFPLKFEKWSKSKHSRPSIIEGYGGWIKIKTLPLDYWSNQTFKVIGDHFGGLENIASETLNLLNVSEAKIQVKKTNVVLYQLH